MMYHIIPAAVAITFCTGLFAPLYHLLFQSRCYRWYGEVAAILCLEKLLSRLVYRLALDPLAKYPGPLLAASTDWYTVYWIANGGRHLNLHSQHSRYGKYVRYGPNRLSINSPDASRDLHQVNSNIFKVDVYGSFKIFFGAEMSLTTVDHKAHAFRRRVNVTALTPTAVKQFAPQILPHIDSFLEIVGNEVGTASQGEEGWGPGVDMSYTVAYCLADIMGSVTFGRTWNAQKEDTYTRYVKDLPKGVAGIHLVGHMQSLFTFNMHKVLFKELIEGVGQLMQISRSFALWRSQQEEMPHPDIWATLLASRDPKTGEAFSKEELISEATLFIIGGTDGMITATVSTLFYLVHNPRTLDRLVEDIRTTFPLATDCIGKPVSEVHCPIEFASQKLQSLTYLTACIAEAMRISPPVPSILPRVVGPGGMVVDGEFFPAGVTLGVPHYSLHRSEAFWPHPLSYIPERWIPGDKDGTENVKPVSDRFPRSGKGWANTKSGIGQAPAFTPFGAGRGSCIGKYLAYQEMSFLLARMLWIYDIRQDPENSLGEGTGDSAWGRGCRDEFQLFDRFVSSQMGPVLQLRVRKELVV